MEAQAISNWSDAFDRDLARQVAEKQIQSPQDFPAFVAQVLSNSQYDFLFNTAHPSHKIYVEELAKAKEGGAAPSSRQKRGREDGGDEQSGGEEGNQEEKLTKIKSLCRPVSLLPTTESSTTGEVPSYVGPHRPYALSISDHDLWLNLLTRAINGGDQFHDCIQWAMSRLTKTEYMVTTIVRVAALSQQEDDHHHSSTTIMETGAATPSSRNIEAVVEEVEGGMDFITTLFFLTSTLFAEHEQTTRRAPYPPYRRVFTHSIGKLMPIVIDHLENKKEKRNNAAETAGMVLSVIKDWEKAASLFPSLVLGEWETRLKFLAIEQPKGTDTVVQSEGAAVEAGPNATKLEEYEAV